MYAESYLEILRLRATKKKFHREGAIYTSRFGRVRGVEGPNNVGYVRQFIASNTHPLREGV